MAPVRSGLVALIAALLAGLASPGLAGAQQATYTARDGSWSVVHPASWEVTQSRDGGAVAFLAPAVQVAGTRFRPSLVVSSSAVEPGVTQERLAEVARAAFERSLPGAQLLGKEQLTARDGGRVLLLYYYSPPGQQGPGLYTVLGLALRRKLYTLVGTTTTAIQDYRQQAAAFRAVVLSLSALR